MNETRASRRRWLQFSLRTLLLLVLLAAAGMSWLAVRVQRAKQERAAVEAIESLQGSVTYDYHLQGGFDTPDTPPPTEPPGPACLRRLLV